MNKRTVDRMIWKAKPFIRPTGLSMPMSDELWYAPTALGRQLYATNANVLNPPQEMRKAHP